MFSVLRGCRLRSACRWMLVDVLQRSFGGKFSPAMNYSHLLCVVFCVICMGNCSWFTDRKHYSQTMNKHISLSWIKQKTCAVVIGGKVYVAWKRKMLHDVTLHDVVGGHLADTKNQLRSQCSLLPAIRSEREREEHAHHFILWNRVLNWWRHKN